MASQRRFKTKAYWPIALDETTVRMRGINLMNQLHGLYLFKMVGYSRFQLNYWPS